MDLFDLPEMLIEQILGYLDVWSLGACCCVCRKWYDSLNDNERIWRKFCEDRGFEQPNEVADKTWSTWKEFAFLVVKRHDQVRSSQCFSRRPRSFTIQRAFTDPEGVDLNIVAMYFYGFRLAVATKSSVQIWDTVPDMTLNFNVRTSQCNSSVKFNDLHIVVADVYGDMESFAVTKPSPIGRCRAPELQGRKLISYDFDSASDIVVGSYEGNPIRIWRLSTGGGVATLGDRFCDMGGMIKIVSMCRPLRDKGLNYLFLRKKDKLLVWTGSYVENCNGIIQWSRNPDVIHHDHPELQLNYHVNILNHETNFLYYTMRHDTERPRQIQQWDLNLRAQGRKIRTPDGIRLLIAVGKKYIAYLTEEGNNINVLEISSGDVLTTFEVPRNIHEQQLDQERRSVVFCRQDWLDGIDLATDKGTILAYTVMDRTVHYVQWITRHAFP